MNGRVMNVSGEGDGPTAHRAVVSWRTDGMAGLGRRPFGRPSWLDEGQDPDYRFSLANERTFLAWVRTSLALLAGAVAVAQIVPSFQVRGARTALAALLGVSGLGVASSAYRRWSSNERAMRHQQALPHTTGLMALSIALCLIALAVLVLVFFGRR